MEHLFLPTVRSVRQEGSIISWLHKGIEYVTQATRFLDAREARPPPNNERRPTHFETPPGAVVRLLERHEGRLQQGEIIEELGWSASKTSRVLSKMEAEDALERYQLGRTKLVCLPGNTPEHVPPDLPNVSKG